MKRRKLCFSVAMILSLVLSISSVCFADGFTAEATGSLPENGQETPAGWNEEKPLAFTDTATGRLSGEEEMEEELPILRGIWEHLDDPAFLQPEEEELSKATVIEKSGKALELAAESVSAIAEQGIRAGLLAGAEPDINMPEEIPENEEGMIPQPAFYEESISIIGDVPNENIEMFAAEPEPEEPVFSEEESLSTEGEENINYDEQAADPLYVFERPVYAETLQSGYTGRDTVFVFLNGLYVFHHTTPCLKYSHERFVQGEHRETIVQFVNPYTGTILYEYSVKENGAWEKLLDVSDPAYR